MWDDDDDCNDGDDNSEKDGNDDAWHDDIDYNTEGELKVVEHCGRRKLMRLLDRVVMIRMKHKD